MKASRRLSAFFIDYIGIGIAFYMMVGMTISVLSNVFPISATGPDESPSALFGLAVLFFTSLYFVVSEIRGGTTLGKDFYGLHVSGSSQQILARNALKFAPIWLAMFGSVVSDQYVETTRANLSSPMMAVGFTLGLVYLCSLFIGSKQSLYDRLSGTVVTYHPNMDRGY